MNEGVQQPSPMFDLLTRPVLPEPKTQTIKPALIRPYDGWMPNCKEAAIV
jgi:hypothetical protein